MAYPERTMAKLQERAEVQERKESKQRSRRAARLLKQRWREGYFEYQEYAEDPDASDSRHTVNLTLLSAS